VRRYVTGHDRPRRDESVRADNKPTEKRRIGANRGADLDERALRAPRNSATRRSIVGKHGIGPDEHPITEDDMGPNGNPVLQRHLVADHRARFYEAVVSHVAISA